MTRFLVLLAEQDHYERWDAAAPDHVDRVMADFRAFSQAVKQRGSVVGGQALLAPETARTLRAGEPGRRPVTEGPFAETVEQLNGFYLIDVDDLATAVELAALLPREYDVEVRPCLDVEVS